MPTQTIPNPVNVAVAWHRTGLTGTLGIRVTKGAVVPLGRSTSLVTEFPAGSGIYQATIPDFAPAGSYTIVWDDFSRYDAVDLTVVGTPTGTATMTETLTITTAGVVIPVGHWFGTSTMAETLTITTAAARSTFGEATVAQTLTVTTSGVRLGEWVGQASFDGTLTITTLGSLNSTAGFAQRFATPTVTAAEFAAPAPALTGSFERPFA